MRGEAALALLPLRGKPARELWLPADNLTAIDAWGSVALRTLIEFAARAQGKPVKMSRPTSKAAWNTLFYMLGPELPAHFFWASADRPDVRRRPSGIVLPAVRIPSLDHALVLSDALISKASDRSKTAVRFSAQLLPELASNSLRHGHDSPTSPVAAIYYDRIEDEVQLVVCDLGGTYDQDAKAATKLRASMAAAPEGALVSAVELAAARGIDATLTVAAGRGRLYWRQERWTEAEAQMVPGFTVALTVPIDQ